jgi:hypothetical protein
MAATAATVAKSAASVTESDSDSDSDSPVSEPAAAAAAATIDDGKVYIAIWSYQTARRELAGEILLTDRRLEIVRDASRVRATLEELLGRDYPSHIYYWLSANYKCYAGATSGVAHGVHVLHKLPLPLVKTHMIRAAQPAPDSQQKTQASPESRRVVNTTPDARPAARVKAKID